MGRKSKLDATTKLSIVRKYVSGQLTFKECLNTFDIKKDTFKKWVRTYRHKGEDCFVTSSKNKIYSYELKIDAINDYLSNKGSLNDICFKYNISSTSILINWIKSYNSHKCIISKTRRKTNMANSRKTTYEERINLVSECIEKNYDYNYIINKYQVSYNQIYNWVRKYKKDGEAALIDNRGKAKSNLTNEDKLNAQIKLLEAENRRLQMENDFIKKLEEVERMEMLKQE